MTIKKRQMGKTGIEITPIGLGVMQMSGNRPWTKPMFRDMPEGETEAIVKAALEGGINWFDTAEMYGFGQSEMNLVTALSAAGTPDADVIIGTKWLPVLRTARSIPRTIKKRIHHLEGYTIDLYMVHMPMSFSSIEAQMNAMADLVEAGKIRSVGVSNFDEVQMRQAHAALAKRGLPLAVNQMQYSLLYRDIETNGVLDAAKELGVTIVAWGPLNSGLLTGKVHDDPEALANTPSARRRRFAEALESSRPVVEALKEIAVRYEATPAQVALNWVINFNGEIVVAIPGASRVRHAVESAGAMNFELTPEELNQLDEVSRGV